MLFTFLQYKTHKLCSLKERTVTFCITTWTHHCCPHFTQPLLQHWYPVTYFSNCSINAFYFLNKWVSALHTPSSTATSLCKWFLSTVVLMANSLRRVGQTSGKGYWYSKNKDRKWEHDEYNLCIHSYCFYSCPSFSTLPFPTPTYWIWSKFRPLSYQLIQSLLAPVPTWNAGESCTWAEDFILQVRW